MPSNRDIKRLQAALDRLEPTVRRQVQQAFEKLRARITLSRLIDAIERRDDFALRALTGSLSSDLARAGETLRAAFTAGAQAAQAELQALKPRVAIAFNATDPASVFAAQQRAAEFVTGVTAQTRKALRAVIARSFSEGLSSRDTAKLIKPLIGLTERQAIAVVNRRAANVAKGWAQDRLAKDAAAYAQRLLKARSVLIARTELASASTAGQVSRWTQAKAQGLIDGSMVQVWITTPDDKLCPVCEAIDGQTTVIGGTFRTDTGDVSGPPAHPNCRCALGLKDAVATRRRVA